MIRAAKGSSSSGATSAQSFEAERPFFIAIGSIQASRAPAASSSSRT